ncbi:hypothetical protein KI809_15670 [Geobacter pelophilus]|uniref:Uncharacterized protein n=1 Tax=Geoanaerobacter pelophilus TaxID=60036 RepID=A0AAW4L458_9BACT|nr:hypothetical protein [Geoanaerobacter pelophilus]MBT0665748.1 hypothetical protein [Geoanaerobacter pelophilus]
MRNRGHQWLIAITMLLLAASAHAITVTVEKRGTGTAIITGSTTCSSTSPRCTFEAAAGQVLTFDIIRDSSNADLLGWGGLCAQFENQRPCTVTLDDIAARRYRGSYPVIAALGYYQDGVCRAPGGSLDYLYFADLPTAYNAVKAAVASNPIDCTANGILTVGNIDTPLVISGGWPDFTPNSQPTDQTSTIAETITVTTGSLTITGGGITIACGYKRVTGPYVVTEPLVIGATPCDFGLIVR